MRRKGADRAQHRIWRSKVRGAYSTAAANWAS